MASRSINTSAMRVCVLKKYITYADIYYDTSGWMENIAWMQKHGCIGPAIVFDAIVGFFIIVIIQRYYS